MPSGRENPFVSANLFPLVVTVALSFFTSCGDLNTFVDHLDDEVKLANDRYLEVESVYPTQNSVFVNPGQDLKVTFDRSVDPLAVLNSVEILDSQGNTFPLAEDDVAFDTITNTLSLMPDPYLDDSRQYSITLKTNLTSREFNPLREEYSWSFSTGTYPKGYFIIHDDVGSTGLLPNYTKSSLIPIEVKSQNAMDYFIDDEEPDARTSTAKSELPWTPLSGNILALSGQTGDTELNGKNGIVFDLGDSPQGLRTVFMMFRDETSPARNYTPVEIGKTFLDTIDPSVFAGKNVGRANLPLLRSGDASDSGSGLNQGSVQWSAPGAVNISAPDRMESTFTGPTDTDAQYTITLTLEDRAGNSGSDSFVLDWDTEAPTAPSVSSSVSRPTSDDTPTWTWTPSSGGIESYERRLDGGTWHKDYSRNFTPVINPISRVGLSDGRHTLDVAQYDDAGNLSDYGSWVVYVNKAAVSPYPDQSFVFTSTSLDWPVYKGVTLPTYRYFVYKPGKTPVYVTGGSTGSSSNSPSLALNEWTDYSWYYEVWRGKAKVYTSPGFSFKTTGTIILPPLL